MARSKTSKCETGEHMGKEQHVPSVSGICFHSRKIVCCFLGVATHCQAGPFKEPLPWKELGLEDYPEALALCGNPHYFLFHFVALLPLEKGIF